MGFLKPYTEHTYALMRIVVGLLFMQHGIQKLMRVWEGAGPSLALYGAGPIELIGGALIAVGLFTSPAAFLCSGTMAFAYFMSHAPQGFLPLLNRGELAAVYCWIFLFIAAKGSGMWSVEAARSKS